MLVRMEPWPQSRTNRPADETAVQRMVSSGVVLLTLDDLPV